VALAFLLLVFLFVIALIAVFAFPPTRWAGLLDKEKKKK
jgi:hypothetical protein